MFPAIRNWQFCKVIYVTFNNLHGFAKQPIAHTCSCTVELSTFYATYLEFGQEFSRIPSSKAVWAMDAL